MESTVKRKDECVKETCHHGIQMSDKELEEYFKAFQDIEECIEELKKKGDDI